MRLIFLTVMPSPYQRQLFAAIAAEPELEVRVRYFTAGAHDRQWQRPCMMAHEDVMSGKTLNFLGPSAHFNPSVLGELGGQTELTVVSDYSAPTAQLAMRALALRGRPFVFWGELPGFSARGPRGQWMRRQLQRPLARASAIAGIGTAASDAYQALYPGKPVYNIPYFCDLSAYRAARDNATPRAGKTVDILFSGQLIERKGVFELLEAFVTAARAVPRLRLILLGSGPQQDALQAGIPGDLRSHVAFCGHLQPSELPAAFAAADIFCLPSRHDGWGVVVNEALGAGLPVVVSDKVGAGHDLVEHGRNGLVVPAGDSAALATALQRLGEDDALRSAMAEAAAEASYRWDLGEGVARWRDAARQILQSARNVSAL